ncbi:hypothetical protein [Paraeggerthella hongkongensis]|uniref:Uncharacterized protein n=1 Tax=Paraeggerthella hongkongensis TaxID=230658 RepID=A0A3N0BJR6_9ACTN|nr:hypothetical protein [Paraeggerthella hongkongensis]RNL48523.1 hypothetical protein DMP08_02670 [Paraeggerthella hongkongensis]
MLRVSEVALSNINSTLKAANTYREGAQAIAKRKDEAYKQLQESVIGREGYRQELDRLKEEETALLGGYESSADKLTADLDEAMQAIRIDPNRVTTQELAFLTGALSLSESDLRSFHDGYVQDGYNFAGMRLVQDAARRCGYEVKDPVGEYINGIKEIEESTRNYGRSIAQDDAYSQNAGEIVAMLSSKIAALDDNVTAFPVVVDREEA